MAKPPVELELVWERDLVLAGKGNAASMTLDSAGIEGPSPVQALAFAFAGCMAMDLVHILQKGRHPFTAVRVHFRGRRQPEDPRRLTAIDLRFTVAGDVPAAAVQRAIDLSREKYCSVWHSMRQDIELDVGYTITETQNSEP